MKKFLLLLLLLLPILGFTQTVKFQYNQSLIFIPVRINNLNLLFLLNTGANTSVIDKRIADKLQLPVVKETDTVVGTAGKQAVEHVKIRSLTIGTTIMKDLVVTKRNIGDFLHLNGQKIDGVLGTDVLKNYALTIDYQAKKIAFQSAKIPAGRKKTISFDMTAGIPRVEMRLNDTFNTFFHFNSGVSLVPSKDVYVNVSPKQWEKLKGYSKNLEHSQYLTGQGVGGGVYLQAVKVNCIELNQRQRIHNGYVIIQPKEGYFKDDNSIGFFGNNLLEKYGRVSVDFIARQIVLPINNSTPAKKKKARRT
ncbi:MAG TPA: retropepsin-like aspartic protease [Flavipsychrobacter sp.]|nr:retropepsin-like aspartic protease [Flavipsychrobacter sp.]